MRKESTIVICPSVYVHAISSVRPHQDRVMNSQLRCNRKCLKCSSNSYFLFILKRHPKEQLLTLAMHVLRKSLYSLGDSLCVHIIYPNNNMQRSLHDKLSRSFSIAFIERLQFFNSWCFIEKNFISELLYQFMTKKKYS